MLEMDLDTATLATFETHTKGEPFSEAGDADAACEGVRSGLDVRGQMVFAGPLSLHDRDQSVDARPCSEDAHPLSPVLACDGP